MGTLRARRGRREMPFRREGGKCDRTLRQSPFCARSLLFWVCSRPMGIAGETSVTSAM